ncbi:AraC-type DNA-binding protein [Cyclobacterium xiamenense]|uniref:AraC-type DNA-binding protein n=1 Tax=Cyclobacterium xiamenense TaxID=1297121 RepID=A0A1H6UIF6_9BACT|nr:helix-turn-helix domain-containing protein [Cyclobacterium xiamenense]SEI87960.1 AraC-type DNA-binding protein [Cyclobacterium xiamenense]
MSLSSVVSLVATAIGVLAILIALFKQQGPFFKKFTFLLLLCCLTYYCLVVFIVDSKLVLTYPHFFKTGSPVFYLLAISILWLGQAHLYEKRRLSTLDYALLLLPIVNIIELLPFFVTPAAEKKAYLLGLFADRNQIIYAFEGWIPTFFHYLFQILIGGLVSFFLLVTAIRKSKATGNQHRAFSWMIVFATISLIFYAIGLALLLADSEEIPIHVLASWLFGLMLLVQLFFLFFRPDVLYGISENHVPTKSTVSPPFVLEEAEAENYRLRINAYFLSHADFLLDDFRQQHLSDHLGIPKNRLSQVIHHLFSKNFNQLINEKRIEIAIQNMQSEAWKNYTIEAIAQEVGFKSRTTFNKAFQEQTGLTPSQFRKQIEHP